MTAAMTQGSPITIERLCRQAKVSRAGYYRFWRNSAPRAHDTTVRDAIQRLALANGRHRGYRLVVFQLRQEGLVVNHKRVLRLMRQDNLLCLRKRPFVPPTTDSRHAWPVVPNLARGMQPNDLDQLWVADITYIRLLEQFAYLAIILDAFSRRVNRLGNGRSSAGQPGHRRPEDGHQAAQAGTRQPDPPLRSRHPIRLQRLHRAAGGAPHHPEHEPHRQSLRQ